MAKKPIFFNRNLLSTQKRESSLALALFRHHPFQATTPEREI